MELKGECVEVGVAEAFDFDADAVCELLHLDKEAEEVQARVKAFTSACQGRSLLRVKKVAKSGGKAARSGG